MVIDRKIVITDTKAILKHIGEKYNADDSLYPTDNRDEIEIAIDKLHLLVKEVYV